jgi:DNA repair protein RadC
MNVLYSADLRLQSDRELATCVSEKTAEEYANGISFMDFINKLSPAKKKFANSVVELYKRSLKDKEEAKSITCSSMIYQAMRPHLTGVESEEFWVIFMNTAAKPIKAQQFSKGGISSTIVDVRLILKEAVLCNATIIALVHSHPSGNTKPSIQDDNITGKIKKAAENFDIRVIDHVIFTDSNYYSYSDEGRL